MLLGVGEAVEFDAVLGVGEAEALEGGEDVAAGRFGGAAFGQQAGELLVVAERGAGLGFDQPEDQQRDPDDADQGVDAVVVVQEDRADLECLFVGRGGGARRSAGPCRGAARARRTGGRGGWSPARRCRRRRRRSSIASWLRCQVSVRLALAGGDLDVDQAGDVGGRGSARCGARPVPGLVVAAAEPVADPRECVLGLDQGALAGGRDLGGFLGGVDVGDAQVSVARPLGSVSLPVAQRALEPVRCSAGSLASRSWHVAQRAQRVGGRRRSGTARGTRRWRAAAR